jgi:hypothetical protein
MFVPAFTNEVEALGIKKIYNSEMGDQKKKGNFQKIQNIPEPVEMSELEKISGRNCKRTRSKQQKLTEIVFL